MKNGDVVMVVGNISGHGFLIGEWVEITAGNLSGGVLLFTCNNGVLSQVLGSNEISKV